MKISTKFLLTILSVIFISFYTQAQVTAAATGDWSKLSTWGVKPGTGIINTDSVTANVTGSGTLFLTEYSVGEVIRTSKTGTPIGIIASITNDSVLVLTANTNTIKTSSTHWVYNGTAVLPVSSDNVLIPDSITVNVDQNVSIANLTIGQGISGSVRFSATAATILTVTGNITVAANANFSVRANTLGLPSPNGGLAHTLNLNGNLTNNGILDFRTGTAGTTLSVCNLFLVGSIVSTLNVPYASSSNGEFNYVTFNKTAPGKIILAGDMVIAGGSSTGPATCQSGINFLNGIVETGSFMLAHLGSTETQVVGGSSTSYVIGTMGRGMSNSVGSNKTFYVGDLMGYRPFQLRSTTAGSATGHLAIVKCISGDANTGSSVLVGGIDKVSAVRYYQVTYSNTLGGAANMKFDRVRVAYGTNDGVNPGNTDLRVAFSTDARATWTKMAYANSHTTQITDPPTQITDSTAAVTLNNGQSMYLTLARATGTTTNPLSQPKNLTIAGLIEGFFNGLTMVTDTVVVQLHTVSSPYSLVESSKLLLNSSGTGTGNFYYAVDGSSYYLAVKHRNGLETWSGSGQMFSGGTLTYDFTAGSGQAYGNNMIQKVSKWCFFSGDVNQDGVIDISDVGTVDIDNLNFVGGYTSTDVNGDNLVDLSDLSIVDTNNLNFISRITP